MKKSYPEVYHKTPDRFTLLSLPSGETLYREPGPTIAGLKFYDFWFTLSHGAVVGYAQLYERVNFLGELVLSSIEIRPEYRGIGLAQELCDAISSVMETKVVTDGKFTPEGERSLSFLPLASMPASHRGVVFASQSFVKDWPLMVSKTAE